VGPENLDDLAILSRDSAPPSREQALRNAAEQLFGAMAARSIPNYVKGLDALARAILPFGKDESYSDIIEDVRIRFSNDEMWRMTNNIRFLHYVLASAKKRFDQENHRVANMWKISELVLQNFAPPASRAVGVRAADSNAALEVLGETLKVYEPVVAEDRPEPPVPVEQPSAKRPCSANSAGKGLGGRRGVHYSTRSARQSCSFRGASPTIEEENSRAKH
jgi:hypothetical protein